MNVALGFSLALSAGLIWSIGNIVHKVLASRLVQSTALLVLSLSLASGLIGGVLLIWFPLVSGDGWFLAGAAAACYLVAVFGYLSALRTEEASRVVPLFGLGSALIVLMSAVFLREVFSFIQYLGIATVLIGAILISAAGDWRSIFRGRLLRFMLLSGTAFALHAVIIKTLLADFSYGSVFASAGLLQAAAGVLLILIWRRHIRETMQRVTWNILALSIITDLVGFGAELLYTIALSVWYLALVETIASLQYFFIFVWGLILSRWFPQVLREPITKSGLINKFIAITLIISGIYLLAQ
ncbi:MAG: DMT family transporter [Candidatus Kerfeldbacteria bacterium]|nr:DMT family transporter [Candidatus Kerfeldbacteria bacterium]